MLHKCNVHVKVHCIVLVTVGGRGKWNSGPSDKAFPFDRLFSVSAVVDRRGCPLVSEMSNCCLNAEDLFREAEKVVQINP